MKSTDVLITVDEATAWKTCQSGTYTGQADEVQDSFMMYFKI